MTSGWNDVTVKLTYSQAKAIERALGVFLDVTEDPVDRQGYGATGGDRNTAERALSRLFEAMREAREATREQEHRDNPWSLPDCPEEGCTMRAHTVSHGLRHHYDERTRRQWTTKEEKA